MIFLSIKLEVLLKDAESNKNALLAFGSLFSVHFQHSRRKHIIVMLSINKIMYKIKRKKSTAWKHLWLLYLKLSKQNKAEGPITMSLWTW